MKRRFAYFFHIIFHVILHIIYRQLANYFIFCANEWFGRMSISSPPIEEINIVDSKKGQVFFFYNTSTEFFLKSKLLLKPLVYLVFNPFFKVLRVDVLVHDTKLSHLNYSGGKPCICAYYNQKRKMCTVIRGDFGLFSAVFFK